MAYVYSNEDALVSGVLAGYLAEERTEPRRISEPWEAALTGFCVGSPAPSREADPSFVRWVQTSLNRATGARLALDGILGPQTREVIRRFQRQHGLRPDGSIGPETERALRASIAATLSVARGVQPPPLGARLIRSEPSPPNYTLYVSILLGGEAPAQPMTGIFVPAGYRPQRRVELVLYLHGFKRNFPDVSIDQYWNRLRFPYWPLREGVNASRKNVVLVAPTLGPRSQTGILTRPGGFDAYVEQVRAALRDYGPYRGGAPPEVGNIILACHSGGGWPMRQLVTSSPPQRYTLHIRECWGFDCLYNTGDEDAWAYWARSRPEGRLFIYYLDSTAARSQRLQQRGVPNVTVARSTAPGHDWVPITHWRVRLEGVPFLPTV